LIRTYLSQRYPLEENKWKIIIPISLFIAFFMIIFQPFGLDKIQVNYKYMIFAGYGLVTFIILVIDLWIIPTLYPKAFREEQWTVYKEILFLLWILFTVGLGNFIYSVWFIGFHLTFTTIIIFQGFTLAVGVIPITALILIKQNYLSRRNRDRAELITTALPGRGADDNMDLQIRICSDNEKEYVVMMVQDFLFIKSDGNYITVGYLKNGKILTLLLRNTLKYAEDLLASFRFIYKCHRSWLVNLNKVSKVRGNSQGLRLKIEGHEEEIPVARSNSAEFRMLITRENS
jgi:hypothetical protein